MLEAQHHLPWGFSDVECCRAAAWWTAPCVPNFPGDGVLKRIECSAIVRPPPSTLSPKVTFNWINQKVCTVHTSIEMRENLVSVSSNRSSTVSNNPPNISGGCSPKCRQTDDTWAHKHAREYLHISNMKIKPLRLCAQTHKAKERELLVLLLLLSS